MVVKCPNCGFEFGNLENQVGAEFYNLFGELVRRYKCPKCGEIFIDED